MLSDLLKMAKENAEKENYGEALKLIVAALEKNPALASAWHLKGMYLRKLDRLDESIECFEKAIEFNPQYSKANCEKGAVLLDMERPREALIFLDRAATANPMDSSAWYLIGEANMMLKRKREAITAYKKAVELGNAKATIALDKCMSRLESFERIVLDENAEATVDSQWLMRD